MLTVNHFYHKLDATSQLTFAHNSVSCYLHRSKLLSCYCSKEFKLKSTSDFLPQLPQPQLLFQQDIRDPIRQPMPQNQNAFHPFISCIYDIFSVNFDHNHPNDDSHIDLPKMCVIR